MRDIKTRADLEFLLSEFYKIAVKDAEIGHHSAELDLESHLPIIVDFWDKMLFGKQNYFGNPLAVHKKLHEKSPLTSGHFRRWVFIFGETIDKYFAGETSENAKLRAKKIAHALNQRVGESENTTNYIQIEE
ncbi:MAG: group III truncated hemoglobin [Aridibacter sp.]